MKLAALSATAVILLVGFFLAVTGRLSYEMPDGGDGGALHIDRGDDAPTSASWRGFQYGRVTATDGQTFEGRLRWGRTEEAFWDDHFNGSKNENPWAQYAPDEALTTSSPRTVFGVEVGTREKSVDLTRPFVARFGDLTQIDAAGRELRATLKSGTVVELDRYDADDVADGIRIWDEGRGIVDLVDRAIRRVEFLPNPMEGPAPARLHGTVTTEAGAFSGFVEWNRQSSLGTDILEGRGEDGPMHVHFEAIRSIERHGEGARLTLHDGNVLDLGRHPDVDAHNRGLRVHDPRFGQLLVRWTSFRRVDFEPAGSGPSYDDFQPGHQLRGGVTVTSAGGRLDGRLVFDLDESEATDTLDARAQEINYSIPFGRIASIDLPSERTADARAEVRLHDGSEVHFDLSGDLANGNGGLLVFDAQDRPTYVPWADVDRIDFVFDPPD